MRYFYDTEFLEDGRTIDLISIGIVADDGREYYAINDEMPVDRIRHHRWLMNNVMRHLPLRTPIPSSGWADNRPPPISLDSSDSRLKPLRVIANEVRDFLLADGGDRDSRELWAWYAAYDHVALCQLWGQMIRLPKGIPMYTRDLKQECDRLGNPTLPEQETGEHDALSDARHNRLRFHHLEREAAR